MNRITFPPDLIKFGKWKAFIGRYPPGSETDHRVIIAYEHDGILKCFYVTSKVNKAKMMTRDDPQSLVCLKQDDWDELTKPCCIQCNKDSMFEISESELMEDYANEKVKTLGEIPDSIKKSIVSAICMSKTFSEKEKAMYTV